MDMLTWGNVSFFANANGVRGLTGLEISGECETEDTIVDEESFTKKKNAGQYKATINAILDRRLGEDVQATATTLMEYARNGDEGYLYTGTGKLFPFAMMMTSAKIGKITYLPGGRWLGCEVTLTLVQCSKYNGSKVTGGGTSSSGGGSASSGGSTKQSVRSTGPVVSAQSNIGQSILAATTVPDANATPDEYLAYMAAKANAATSSIISNAKTVTNPKLEKTPSTSSGTSSGASGGTRGGVPGRVEMVK